MTSVTGFHRTGRTFWIVNAAIFVDEVVYVALVPLLALYAHRFSLSILDVGLLYAAYPLLSFVSSIPGGALADRVGPRPPILAGLSLFVAATVAFALAHSIGLLLLARGMQGLAAGVVGPAGLAAITAAVPSEHRGETLGITTGLQGLSGFAGPLIGAVGATTIGLGRIYSVPAAIGAVLLIAVKRMQLPPHEVGHTVMPPLWERIAGRDVRAAVAFILALGLAGGTVQTLTPVQLESAGLSASAVGALFAIAAILAVGLAPLTGRLGDRRGLRPATALWTTVSVTVLVGLALSDQTWITAVLLVCFLPQIRTGGTLSYALGAGGSALDGRLGASFGIAIAAWSIGASIGPIVSGFVAQEASRSVAYGLAAALTLLLLTPALRSRRPSLL